MTWVKLDDQWADHPKFLKVGDFATLMWVKGLTYSARYLLDGRLPNVAVARLIHVRAWKLVAAKLVAADLWEQTEDGYLIHDYQKYQPLREAVLAERALAALRMKRGRSGVRSPEQTPNERRSSPEVRLPRPDPVPDPDLTSTRSAALGKPGARDPERCAPVVPIQEAQSETRMIAAKDLDKGDQYAPTDRLVPETGVNPRGLRPPNEEPLTPDDARIREAIRNLPKLADLDASDLAQQACSQMLTKGSPIAWILTAIQDASDKSQRGEPSSIRHARVVGFIRHAKAPKADEREQKSGPAYREATFEPGELEHARRLVPRRPKLDDAPPVSTDEQRARAMALVSGIGKGGS